MEKANYGKIATSYDRHRFLSESNITRWMDLILRYSKAKKGDHVLDLGCGTGRFTLPIAKKLECRVTGADLSKEMLARAKEKDTDQRVFWELVDAGSLTYQDDVFVMIFMSHLLHHVDNPKGVIRECMRVLKPKGTILIRYGAIEQIQHDVIHTFFPDAMAIDEQRAPTHRQVEEWLEKAGFLGIVSKEVIQQTYESSEEQLRTTQGKSTSVLGMISNEAFERGIRSLTQYVKQNPTDPWLLFDRMTLTVGYKESN